jgi:hypothetical protein
MKTFEWLDLSTDFLGCFQVLSDEPLKCEPDDRFDVTEAHWEREVMSDRTEG